MEEIFNDQESNYLKELRQALRYGYSEFDKNLLYISSGTLGISLMFIEKIIVLDKAKEKWLLILSWGILTFTILLSLVLHLISCYGIEKTIENINYHDDVKEQKRIDKLNLSVSFLNWVTIIFLVAGISVMLIFISINI